MSNKAVLSFIAFLTLLLYQRLICISSLFFTPPCHKRISTVNNGKRWFLRAAFGRTGSTDESRAQNAVNPSNSAHFSRRRRRDLIPFPQRSFSPLSKQFSSADMKSSSEARRFPAGAFFFMFGNSWRMQVGLICPCCSAPSSYWTLWELGSTWSNSHEKQ